MKSLSLSISLLFLSTLSIAQIKADKQKEFGITISRFSFESIPFDLVYKIGTDDKFWRFEAGSLYGSFELPEYRLDSITTYERNNTAGLGLRVAREKRKKINEKLTFFHGMEFGLSGYYRDQSRFNSHPSNGYTNTYKKNNLLLSVTPHLGYAVGAIFNINDHFYTSLELSPSMSYQISYEKESNLYTFNPTNNSFSEKITHRPSFNFTQGAVSIGLFYRI
jgi:hypothetical protein